MGWLIRGYEGSTLIIERRLEGPGLDASEHGEAAVRELLTRLACSAMTPDEILAASLPHGAHSAGGLDIACEESAHGRILSTTGARYFTAQPERRD